MQRRTNKGQVIDFDSLIAQQGSRPALGNMGTDAKGNKLGKGGRVVMSNEERVRRYHRDTTTSVNEKASLNPKNKVIPEPDTDESLEGLRSAFSTNNKKAESEKPKTTKKSKKSKPSAPKEDNITDKELEPEPLGYNEVHLPNGDIEMEPYYHPDDKQ